jgi:hypothetical protein
MMPCAAAANYGIFLVRAKTNDEPHSSLGLKKPLRNQSSTLQVRTKYLLITISTFSYRSYTSLPLNLCVMVMT